MLVEMNPISCAFAGLSTKVNEMHRFASAFVFLFHADKTKKKNKRKK